MAVAKAPSIPWYGATLKEWLFTTDHKKVGMLYLVTSLLYFAVAGLFGMLVRFEQTAPGIQLPSLFGKTGQTSTTICLLDMVRLSCSGGQ
jgi:cytochrome c oxidase subunit 1